MSRSAKPPTSASRSVRPERARVDRRVRRTRDRLGDALVTLLQEVPFDTITVQQVLDRAGVARSTFYTHFSDKDDLLLSDADEFFAHVAEARPFVAALKAAGRFETLLALGRGHFAHGIEARLAEEPRARSLPAARRAALSEALAGALMALLTSWLARGTPEPAEELDALFHRLVWGTLWG